MSTARQLLSRPFTLAGDVLYALSQWTDVAQQMVSGEAYDR